MVKDRYCHEVCGAYLIFEHYSKKSHLRYRGSSPLKAFGLKIPGQVKIIWHQQGPWLNQHSAQFFNNYEIAVFGNNVYGNKLPSPFMYKEGYNEIYLYSFKTNRTNKQQSNALGIVKPMTVTEGRLRVLEDKSIFIEETNNGRLLKLNPSGQLIWSYINTYDEDHLGAIAWSRYLTREEIHATINISNMKCNQ